MPAIHFTPLVPPDIRPVIEIERTSFQRPWPPFTLWREFQNTDSMNYVVRYTNSGSRSRIIAYTCQRLLRDELHILKVAVIRQWRRFGVGGWLLGKCLGLSSKEGAQKAYLCVRPSNQAAVCLYHKLGFQTIGESPGYYSETGENALVMRKNLQA